MISDIQLAANKTQHALLLKLARKCVEAGFEKVELRYGNGRAVPYTFVSLEDAESGAFEPDFEQYQSKRVKPVLMINDMVSEAHITGRTQFRVVTMYSIHQPSGPNSDQYNWGRIILSIRNHLVYEAKRIDKRKALAAHLNPQYF